MKDTGKTLTQSEKLEALVKRAIEDGWKPVEKEFEWRVIDTYPAPFLSIMIAIVDTSAFDGNNVVEKKLTVNDIIFNHDFAKALFGEQDHDLFVIGTTGNGEHTTVNHPMPSCDYHLQHAVMAPNPIDYMYDEVFGK